jgi:hypothetical protein
MGNLDGFEGWRRMDLALEGPEGRDCAAHWQQQDGKPNRFFL